MTSVGACRGCEVDLQADGGSVMLCEQGVTLVRCPRCAVPNLGFQQVKVACGRMLRQVSGRPNAFTTVVPRARLIHFTPATLRGLLVRAGLQPLLIRPGAQNAPKRKESYWALKRATKLLLCEGSELCFAATGRVVGQEIVALAKAG